MYGEGYVQFKPFKGSLPHGLEFEIKRQKAEKLLGRKPAWIRDDKTHARWDFSGHCLFLRFGDESELGEVSVQLPVK
jgi:hypothetical protein